MNLGLPKRSMQIDAGITLGIRALHSFGSVGLALSFALVPNAVFRFIWCIALYLRFYSYRNDLDRDGHGISGLGIPLRTIESCIDVFPT